MGKRGGIGGSGRGGIFGSEGVFFLSIDAGGVMKTDETAFDDFRPGVEQMAIALKEVVAFPGTRSAASSLIRTRKADASWRLSEVFSANFQNSRLTFDLNPRACVFEHTHVRDVIRTYALVHARKHAHTTRKASLVSLSCISSPIWLTVLPSFRSHLLSGVPCLSE